MLHLFNSLGQTLEPFRPAANDPVTVFTCGPSVYQRAHIGNYRTFLFEDVLVRYLEYCGFRVHRGMVVTDVEDKAIQEAGREGTTVAAVTRRHLAAFLREMELLRARPPDFLGPASEYVAEAADIIALLLEAGIAYRHGGNIYFDPLKYPRFGVLAGLDMSRWPKERRRFHRDTYPGMRWNRGDFILWHGCPGQGDACWETPVGLGRPSWNVQDASVIKGYTSKTLSIYCGGIDNLVRHHDYTLAILESIRPDPAARFWLHGNHLYANRKKMSKSRGNTVYLEDLLSQGYSAAETRFFLIAGHYRRRMHFSERAMARSVGQLRRLRAQAVALARAAEGPPQGQLFRDLKGSFTGAMNRDLSLGDALDALEHRLSMIDMARLNPREAASGLAALRKIDSVVRALFD